MICDISIHLKLLYHLWGVCQEHRILKMGPVMPPQSQTGSQQGSDLHVTEITKKRVELKSLFTFPPCSFPPYRLFKITVTMKKCLTVR